MAEPSNALVDASFWVHAFGAGLLPFALRRFTVHYAPEVAAELPDRYPSGREFWRLVRAGELHLAAAEGDRVGAFGPGERAVLTAALAHRDWIVLIDDWRPLEWAATHGLRVLPTPVFVTMLLGAGEISAAEAARMLDYLAQTRTVSSQLIDLARSLLGPVNP